MLMFLCITPIPPNLAIAIAMIPSVTVSIAAETNGMLSDIFLENFDCNKTFRGSTSEKAGISKTSSNVKPSPAILSSKNDIVNRFCNNFNCAKITKNICTKRFFLFFWLIMKTEAIQAILKQYWGYDYFRPMQED